MQQAVEHVRTIVTGRASRTAGLFAVLTVAGYAAYAGLAWLRYGHPLPPRDDERDPLLDRFMRRCEVSERHRVRVHAPADVTLAAAAETDLMRSQLVRAIFRAREIVLGARPDPVARPRGLLDQMTSLGWGVLAHDPGREIVVGAVTQPWKPTVIFRAVPADAFAAFDEPGYVKIVWTLRADQIGPCESIFRTETRVTTTDADARARFRCYWARFSAGIVLIRRLSLIQVKREAERRVARHETREQTPC
jgi:hypothetical protein